MAVRITQAGVALTVGIIIVTGLIIGGFFWVKTAGEQARRDDAIKIAEQNLEKQLLLETVLKPRIRRVRAQPTKTQPTKVKTQ